MRCTSRQPHAARSVLQPYAFPSHATWCCCAARPCVIGQAPTTLRCARACRPFMRRYACQRASRLQRGKTRARCCNGDGARLNVGHACAEGGGALRERGRGTKRTQKGGSVGAPRLRARSQASRESSSQVAVLGRAACARASRRARGPAHGAAAEFDARGLAQLRGHHGRRCGAARPQGRRGVTQKTPCLRACGVGEARAR